MFFMQHLAIKNELKESDFIIANYDHVNADKQKHILVNRDVKDAVLVKKFPFGFVMSLRNRFYDSHHTHSLDVNTTDNADISTNDVENKKWNAHAEVQTHESRMD